MTGPNSDDLGALVAPSHGRVQPRIRERRLGRSCGLGRQPLLVGLHALLEDRVREHDLVCVPIVGFPEPDVLVAFRVLQFERQALALLPRREERVVR